MDIKEKTYQTWEVIKMLEENPSLEFKCLNDNGYYDTIKINEKNQIAWDGRTDCPLHVVVGEKGLLWVLKKQPVDFMTAVKAYSQGKKILCEINGLKYPYIPIDKTKCTMGYLLSDNKSELPISTREILEGAWYIED